MPHPIGTKGYGAAAPEDHSIRVLIQRQDMTGAERAWVSHHEVDDVMRHAHGSKNAGIEADSHGAIVAINSPGNLLIVEKASGKLAIYDPRHLTGITVYREIIASRRRVFSITKQRDAA